MTLTYCSYFIPSWKQNSKLTQTKTSNIFIFVYFLSEWRVGYLGYFTALKYKNRSNLTPNNRQPPTEHSKINTDYKILCSQPMKNTSVISCPTIFATRWQYITIVTKCGLSKLVPFIIICNAWICEQKHNKKSKLEYENEISVSDVTNKKLFPLSHRFHLLLSTLMTWAMHFVVSYISRIFPCALSIDVKSKMCKLSW